jgi:hypothetical protein
MAAMARRLLGTGARDRSLDLENTYHFFGFAARLGNAGRDKMVDFEKVRDRDVTWSRLSEQLFRVDKWSFCRVKLPCGGAAE